MHAELSLNENVHSIECYMQSASIGRESPRMVDLLKLYCVGEFEGDIRKRIGAILEMNGLVEGGRPTSRGDDLLKNGTMDVFEEGEYQVQFIDIIPNDESCCVALERKPPSNIQRLESSGYSIDTQLYDMDQKKVVHAKGKLKRYNLEDKLRQCEMRLSLDDDSVGCKLKLGDNIEADVEVNVSSDELMHELINDYDEKRKAVIVRDLNLLTPEQKKEMNLSIQDSDQGWTSTNLYGRPLRSVRVDNLSLCTDDKLTAEKWISELRIAWWKNGFVTVDQARIDQEYWSEKLLGEKTKNLVKEGDELLISLNNSPAYWSVAAMRDLMPDRNYPVPFHISSKKNYNRLIMENVFPKKVTDELVKVIMVDPYPGHQSEKVLRYWMNGDEATEIIFLINRARSAMGGKALLSKSDLSSHARIEYDGRSKENAHSRNLILVLRDNRLKIWNIDNSIGQFNMVDGEVVTKASMKFTPEARIGEDELDKILEGLL